MVQIQQLKVAAHFQPNDRYRNNSTYHKTPRHPWQFLTRAFRIRNALRLQCHAADWTGTGLVAPNLRMHRAGVNGFRNHRLPC